jgi:farnesyl diphosphate synthase
MAPPQSKKDRFVAVFPKLQAELLEHLESNYMPEDAKAWYKKARCVL